METDNMVKIGVDIMKDVEDMEDVKMMEKKDNIEAVEYSEWTCYLFGATKTNLSGGIVYTPTKEAKIPNIIQRYFLKVFLHCVWEKKSNNSGDMK